MGYSSAYAAPKRWQWELSSAPSQSENCGPTAVTQIAGFYRDRWFGIEATRRLVAAPQTPTHAWQQRDMLIARGVPATVRVIDTLAELHGLVDTGRRPIVIGIQMSRVPDGVRGHPFEGWHAVTVLGRAVVNGQNGCWLTDGNFSAPGGIRPDPARGSRFYSDGVLQWAYIANSPRYAVVPDRLKLLPVTVTTKYVRFNAGVNGVNIRSQPDARQNNVFAVAGSKYIVRTANGQRLALTFTRIKLIGQVLGPDGESYFRVRLRDTTADTFVNTQFLHRI